MENNIKHYPITILLFNFRKIISKFNKVYYDINFIGIRGLPLTKFLELNFDILYDNFFYKGLKINYFIEEYSDSKCYVINSIIFGLSIRFQISFLNKECFTDIVRYIRFIMFNKEY